MVLFNPSIYQVKKELQLLNRKNLLEYLVVFLLIASSGFPYFLEYHKIIYPLILVILLFIALYNNRFTNSNVRFILFSVFLIILLFILQGIKFSFLNSILFSSLFSFLVRVIIGYLVIIVIINNNFWEYFVKIIKFFTAISLFFYILLLLIPNIEYQLIQIAEQYFSLPIASDVSYAPSVLLYSLNIHDPTIFFIIRNPGPFWEPGVFAGFLNLAMIVNAIKGFGIFNKKNYLFIAALLTTFSTGGFLLFFINAILLNILIGSHKYRFVKIIFSTVFLLAFISLYNNISFLGNKVDKQYTAAKEGGKRGRFGSAFTDLGDIYKYPILGRSRVPQLRYDKTYSSFNIENHRVCGVTDFIVKFGIPFSLFFFYYIFLGFKRLSFVFNQRDYLLSYIFFISFLIFALYEPIMQLPLVFFLFFNNLTLPKYRFSRFRKQNISLPQIRNEQKSTYYRRFL